jgi:antitoxin component YwqK of YwqJK toxin-antitoxin module
MNVGTLRDGNGILFLYNDSGNIVEERLYKNGIIDASIRSDNSNNYPIIINKRGSEPTL